MPLSPLHGRQEEGDKKFKVILNYIVKLEANLSYVGPWRRRRGKGEGGRGKNIKQEGRAGLGVVSAVGAISHRVVLIEKAVNVSKSTEASFGVFSGTSEGHSAPEVGLGTKLPVSKLSQGGRRKDLDEEGLKQEQPIPSRSPQAWQRADEAGGWPSWRNGSH